MGSKTRGKFDWVVFILIFALVFSSLALADNELKEGGQANPDNKPGENEDADKPPKRNPASPGDPVFLPKGEYELGVQDVYVSGRVLDVVMRRQYRSKSEYNSRFGYGWDTNYNLKVRRLKDPNTIVFLDGQGRRLEYTRDANDPNIYARQEEPGDFFEYNDIDDTFTYVKKHGTELWFDIDGNLSKIVDRNNNSITFTYDANGLLPIYGPSDFFLSEALGGPSGGRGLVAMTHKLTKITDDLGRDIDLTYDANGLLSSIADFASRTITYTYDPNTNDLLTATGPGTDEFPSGLTTTYTYDSSHNLLTCTDANGQTYVTNTYDSNNMVSVQTYGDANYTFVYNPDSNEGTVTDRRGYDTNIVYNEAGSVASRTVYTSNLRQGDPNSYTTSYEYNSMNEITRKTSPAGNWIDYTYDAKGNVLSICREPNNGEPNIITTFTYDPNFNFVKTATDPIGNVTTYAYDANGNMTSIMYPTVSTPTGNANAVVSFTYNSYGQVETSTSVDDIVTKYEYYTDVNDANNYGRLWKVIVDANQLDPNRLEITTEFEYDVLGRVIEVNDPNGNITSSVYNNLDQLTKTTDPCNDVTHFSYNNVKKLAQTEREISGPNQITSFTYNILDKLETVTNPLTYVTKYSYDNSENLSDANDAEENKTHYDYDERNLLWKVTDANGNVTEYSYTLNGKLAKIKDANDNETTYNYDGFDRLTCITYPDDTNEVFSYDKNSNLTSFKNRKDETIYYEYDAMNRMTVKNRPGDPNIVYRYNIASRLYDVNDGRSVSNAGGITTYKYDRVGRVIEVNDIESRLVKYEYNDRSLRTKLTYPDNSYITYEYDALGRLTEIKDDYGNSIAEYTYDELSRRTLVTLDNDANAVYEYNLNNRLTKLTNNIDDGNLVTFEYSSYDKVGNRKSCKIDDANAHVYQYDNLYQLIFVDYNDGNSTYYYYDALGNRTDVNENGTIIDHNNNSLNQYTSVDGNSYSYDDNGNLIDDGTYKYYYDYENRLTDVNDANDDPVASYKYDYQARRVKKIVYGSPNVITKYCYDGDQVIAEYDVNNILLRKFIYGPGTDEPICMIDVDGGTETYYYYHFDGMGSVVALSDDDGNIVESYSYDVFGEPNTESTIGNPFMFAGRRYDNEAGLYYYRARYYNPDIGRFLQADPIGYAAGLNLYTYCGNNPLNYTDPYGLCKEAIEDALAALRERFDQFLSMHPRFEKFWQGRYFGTGYGEQAADWYVQRFLESDTIIGKAGYGLGGGLASLWLPESWKITALTLGTAGGKIVAKTNVVGATEPTHIGYKFLGKNIIHYGRHIPYGRHLGLLPSTGKNALIHLYGNRLFFSLGKVQFALPHSQTAILYTGYVIGGHQDQ